MYFQEIASPRNRQQIRDESSCILLNLTGTVTFGVLNETAIRNNATFLS